MFRKNPEYIFLYQKKKKKGSPRFFLDGEKFSTEKKKTFSKIYSTWRDLTSSRNRFICEISMHTRLAVEHGMDVWEGDIIYIYICIEIRDRIRRKKRKGKGSRHSFLRRFSFINLINTANRGYGLWIEVTRQSRKSYWMEKTIACHCVASAPSLANRYAFAYRRPFARRGNPRKRTVIHLQPWNCCGEKVYYRRIILLSWNFNR